MSLRYLQSYSPGDPEQTAAIDQVSVRGSSYQG